MFYQTCFISHNVLHWPCLSAINILCFIVTSLNTKRARSGNSEINSISETDIVAIFARVALLGLLQFYRQSQRFLNFCYVFQVVNGLQGVYFFVPFGFHPFIGRSRKQESQSLRMTVSRHPESNQMQLDPVIPHSTNETKNEIPLAKINICA